MRFLGEGLNDPDRPKCFAHHRANAGNPILTGPRQVADAPTEQHDRQDCDRDTEQHEAGQLGRQREQINDPAHPHEQVAQRNRHRGADNLFDHRSIRRHPRRDFGRPVLLKEAGVECQQMRMHRASHVGDDPLPNPRYEIETDCGCQSHHRNNAEQAIEIGGNCPRLFGAKAFINDEFEPARDGER